MERYTLNISLPGYINKTIDIIEPADIKNSIIVTVIDKTCDSETGTYYKLIKNLIKNNNRIIIIGIDDGNVTFKPLSTLLITYDNYDVYTIASKELISNKYIDILENRKPDLMEVQTFIGGDITAYNDISTLLFGIESLVNEGSIDKLGAFIEEHLLSIENLSSTLNSMKKICDMFHSDELIDKVNKAMEDKAKAEADLDNKEMELKELKFNIDKLKVITEDTRKENIKLIDEKKELEELSNAGGNIIRTFKEINTQLLNCKTDIILYFKEVSYVQYTNTLIEVLFSYLERNKLKVKLLIYDTQTGMYKKYKGLTAVSGKEYVLSKSTLISQTKKFVVAEPNPSVLEDIITSDQCFNVVIIYDRTQSLNDLVSGNNVSKFYVINSSTDYDELKVNLKINDNSFIITHASSSIDKDSGKPRKFLDIPYIQGFSPLSSSAKFSRYIKLNTLFSKVPLIETIIKKSRIDTIIKR